MRGQTLHWHPIPMALHATPGAEPGHLGTPEQCVAQIKTLQDQGVDYFYIGQSLSRRALSIAREVLATR